MRLRFPTSWLAELTREPIVPDESGGPGLRKMVWHSSVFAIGRGEGWDARTRMLRDEDEAGNRRMLALAGERFAVKDGKWKDLAKRRLAQGTGRGSDPEAPSA